MGDVEWRPDQRVILTTRPSLRASTYRSQVQTARDFHALDRRKLCELWQRKW